MPAWSSTITTCSVANASYWQEHFSINLHVYLFALYHRQRNNLLDACQVAVFKYKNITVTAKETHVQPSQNVPAAGDFASYNKISAAYFPLKFIDNKDEVSTSSNRKWKKKNNKTENVSFSCIKTMYSLRDLRSLIKIVDLIGLIHQLSHNYFTFIYWQLYI